MCCGGEMKVVEEKMCGVCERERERERKRISVTRLGDF